MKARNRRSGFDVSAIRMPYAFTLGAIKHPGGSVVVTGPKGGRRVLDEQSFARIYEVTEPEAEIE